MRGVWISVALLYTLASIFLVQVLAAPEAKSNPARSVNDNKAREPIRQPGARHIDAFSPGLEVRVVSSTTAAQPDVEVGDAQYTTDGAVQSRVEKAQIERDSLAGRDQAWTVRSEREAVSFSPIVERQDEGLDKSSLVLRSSAPKVFGVSIYLIIAWLALMYLMYRTGSF